MSTSSSFRTAASADREARVLLNRFGRLLHSSGAEGREFSHQERTQCSKDSVLLSSTFVDKRYQMEQAILDEVDFLRRFGSHTLLDGDTQSPVGRQGSTELLRGLVEQMKTVWVIENQLYVLNHILKLRRQYGILDDVAIVFMTTFEFKYNATLQVVKKEASSLSSSSPSSPSPSSSPSPPPSSSSSEAAALPCVIIMTSRQRLPMRPLRT